jgi:GNAT superfamily N-acetyltransferase
VENNGLKIREYAEGDEEKISDLLYHVSDSPRNVDYWKWKYKNNPAGFFPNLIRIADYQGTPGSYYALIPYRIRAGGRVLLAAQSLDTVTSPKYRRQGLFQTLARKTVEEAANNGVFLVFGYPGRMSYGGFLKIGWTEVLLIPKHYRVLSIRKALKCGFYWNLIKKTRPRKIYTAAKIFRKATKKQDLTEEEARYLGLVRDTLLLIAGMVSNPFALFYFRHIAKVKDVLLHQVNSFDDRINVFWDKMAKEFNVVVERDHQYLNWRYCKDPLHKYEIFLAETEAEIVGYMVLRCEYESAEGLILEIFAFQNNVFCSLIEAAERYFKDSGMVTVQCWMAYHHRYAKLLRKSGFFSHRWVARFCLRWFHLGFLKGVFHPLIVVLGSQEAGKTGIDFLNELNWFVAMGDQS